MKKEYIFGLILLFFVSCSHGIPDSKKTDKIPSIFPDYIGVTIPSNIAPLNFKLTTDHTEAYVVFSNGDQEIIIKASKGQFSIPRSKWRALLKEKIGQAVDVTVYARESEWISFSPFQLYIAKEPIDPYIAYRLIEPGYELWNRMGIYQRNLESYDESPIMENKMSGNNCMNCHSFCMQDPDKMLFHMRATYPGTYLIDGDKIEKLNTKTEQTISTLVYPSWHPSGKFVAFSVNDTQQGFHQNDRNRVEVFDSASDVVVYDVEKHEIVTTSMLFSKQAFETFPTFSSDGKTLYFCTAEARTMPKEFKDVKYSLCSISFDPDSRSFGTEVDTLYNASLGGQSVSFPRVSPDGRFLMYTLSGYGNFSIWHKDADLHLIDLSSNQHKALDTVNSDDVESYHSWSSNSRWVVFSSRRIDGLYTRPYIVYMDEDGETGKPFLLPQKDTGFYHRFMKSYNIPEFITGKVKQRGHQLGKIAKKEKGIDVKFK